MKFHRGAVTDEGWETLSSETRYEDPNLSVATVEVRSPGKSKARCWTVAQRKAAVVLAALTAEGRLVLIREERIPVQAALWSVPAGQVDDGATDEAALRRVALRELAEETGYILGRDGEMVSLGYFFSSPGFTDECGFCFLARPVEPGPDGAAHAESESILDCRAFAAGELREMIARGEICDANTLSICAKLSARGLLSLQPGS